MTRHAVFPLIVALLVGCGTSSSEVDYRPTLDPDHVADVIDNPYLPLTVGSEWHYEGQTDEGLETITVVVTGERRTVMGISAFVVRDTVALDGQVIEDTYDWFVQDEEGNVWYLGEDVKDYEEGVVVSTAGSWEAGIDGALPGIVMPANPTVGATFRQEYYAGEAEDMFQIVAVDGSLQVPLGTFERTITTRDWTPLDPDVIEEKWYAFGVGLIFETHVAGGTGTAALVSYTAGG